ncbi:MAG TPA: 2-phospho-L-lactate transferase, partial [Candidatus Limnocylindrales bacterium]|nr:2-phospho-L-lactate transferase [Candidatus Limnocylindrales bacterium]
RDDRADAGRLVAARLTPSGTDPVVVLAGGVGGAKLAEGLQAILGDALTVIVNTADDTERHGLLVCADHDTVMYTLAGLENQEFGWGLAGDTWAAMGALERYGEEGWFRLGDQDLATHIVRTARLRDGERLTTVCRALQQRLGVRAAILPMSDEPVRTEVRTDDGWLAFQDYFVRLRQAPDVHEVRFAGIEAAGPTPEVVSAIDGASLIVIAPSNPIVSVGPILAVPGLRDRIGAARERGTRVVAVSGIIGGKALKGPADRMLTSLGEEPTALGVARRYGSLIDTFFLDTVDAELAPAVEALGVRAVVADTIMTDEASRARLAGALLAAVRG